VDGFDPKEPMQWSCLGDQGHVRWYPLQTGTQSSSDTSLVTVRVLKSAQARGLALSVVDPRPSQLALTSSVAMFNGRQLKSLAVLQALRAAAAQRNRIAI
jgi:hypothetical protein